MAMLPRVLCVCWGNHSWWCSRQRGGIHAYSFSDFSRKGVLDARPPPGTPTPGIEPTTFRVRVLRLAPLS